MIVHYAADQPERAKLQCNGATFRVIYYGRSWPDDELYTAVFIIFKTLKQG